MTEAIYELPESYRQLQARARSLVEGIQPFLHESEAATSFVPEVRAALAASGLARAVVPAEYGGLDDRVDPLAVTVIREVLASGSGHLDSMFAMQGIGSLAISRGGSEALRRRWLPGVAAMELIAALALTEPDVGSDLKQLSTTIEPDGEELVINGHKSFITNAGEADYYLVLGRERDEFTLVLVPADTPGLSISTPYELIAAHVLGDVVLEGVRVPVGNRIGAAGQGFALVLATLASFRVSVAGAALGMAESALREALEHAKSRELFGVPLATLGGIPASLATSWIEIESARTLAYRAAARAAIDPLAALTLSSMAKVAGTEAAGRVVDRSVQIMGRFGIVHGSRIEHLYRELRAMRIYEGSTEVLLDSIAKQLVKKGLP